MSNSDYPIPPIRSQNPLKLPKMTTSPISNPIQKLVNFAEKYARVARPSIQQAIYAFGQQWCNEFETMLQNVYGEDHLLETSVKGYGRFIVDSMRRQRRFEIEQTYPAKTYAEAEAEVYLNDVYMEQQYLPSLLLSHFLWPHHYQQLIYFRSFFVPAMRARKVSSFAEVGVGTGIYSRIALEELPKAYGTGFDISPVSLKFAGRHVASYGFEDRYQTLLQDIIKSAPKQKFEAVVCVEVLEHLEDPVALLMALKTMVASGGKLFVTAALNAAHADHIYLYRESADVLAQVNAAGLLVENLFFANAYAPPKKNLPVPAALAMILSVE